MVEKYKGYKVFTQGHEIYVHANKLKIEPTTDGMLLIFSLEGVPVAHFCGKELGVKSLEFEREE